MAATPKPKRNTPTKRRTSNTTKRKPSPPTTTTTTTALHREAIISAVRTALSAANTFIHDNDLHLLPSHTLSLESSLSKIQSFLTFHPTTNTPPKVQSLPQQSYWFERFVLSTTYTDEDPRWFQIFRMSKPTFSSLNSALSPSLSSALPPSFPPHFALGCALYRLAHDGSFSFVGRRFGFSPGDACRAFYTVCKVICEELGGFVSGFGSDMKGVLMGFEEVIQLKNCCGVLGVEKFGVEGELLGKDGCLIVQGLVDCDGKLMDVSVGWPSTFEPESILRQTRLFVGEEESKELLKGPEIELFDGNLVGQYVLGDSCYPCLPWLVTPFVGKGEDEDLSSSEIEFNEVHKRAMWLVRMAFGRVRANWLLLNRRWKQELVEFLPFIITTACVLNNFLMKHGETLPDVVVGRGEVMELPACEGEVSENAARIRNLLALHLSRVSQR